MTRRGRPQALTHVAVLVLGGTATLMSCSTSGGSEARTVLVDYKHDELASSFIGFFPDRVNVHPGDTVVFEQTWTGEPHSVTYTSSLNAELGRLMDMLSAGQTMATDESDDGLDALAELPAILGRPGEPFAVNQNAAQPCYLEAGSPPIDPGAPCEPVGQPPFTGTHSYYSSGFISPETDRFELRLARDIEPGRYNFFCTLHGVGQATAIHVKPETEPVPSNADVARAARRQIEERFANPLLAAVERADEGVAEYGGVRHRKPLSGLAADDVKAWTGNAHRRHLHRHGSINEFLPADLEVEVGEEVTWTFIGRHTISFNVPRYFPIFSVDGDGTIRIDRRAHEPVDWPGRPPDASRTEPVLVDAGEWDGRGFRSTGLDWENGDRYSVTFTEAGTYSFACLIHPPMVGTVVVT